MTTVVNFPISIVDADVPRIQTATRALFGMGLSDAEIIETLRLELVNRIIAIVQTYERNEAIRLAKLALDQANNLHPVVGVS